MGEYTSETEEGRVVLALCDEREKLRAEVARLTAERDEARAWRDTVAQQAEDFHAKDCPPLLFSEDALYVPVETYRERAGQAFTFAGAVQMLTKELRQAKVARLVAERDEARAERDEARAERDTAIGDHGIETVRLAVVRADRAEAERDRMRAVVEAARNAYLRRRIDGDGMYAALAALDGEEKR